jgi:hypothetical protein
MTFFPLSRFQQHSITVASFFLYNIVFTIGRPGPVPLSEYTRLTVTIYLFV